MSDDLRLETPNLVVTSKGKGEFEISPEKVIFIEDRTVKLDRNGRPVITACQRDLLIHMKNTGGWMHGDPIKVSTASLHALSRKGLILFKCSAFDGMLPAWQWSAELTDAGRAFFEGR